VQFCIPFNQAATPVRPRSETASFRVFTAFISVLIVPSITTPYSAVRRVQKEG
jgi:hypothetical protein